MFGARWPTCGLVAQIQTQCRTEILLRQLIQIQNEKIKIIKSGKATRLFGARWPTSGNVAQIQTQGRTEILSRKLIQIQNEKIQNKNHEKRPGCLGPDGRLVDVWHKYKHKVEQKYF